MSKILIYDVAAESGGALTVLKQYYNKAIQNTENEYYLVTSVIDFEETGNLHMILLPWVKKSWIHRIVCDLIYMPSLIKKLNVNQVLSLQNIGIRFCKPYQTVYVHNAIPFTEHRFSIIQDMYLWFYQNIIGKMTISSLKKVDKIIVQTAWMKHAIIKKCGIDKTKIDISRINADFTPCKERIFSEKIIFFYPAAPFSFKNHQVIIDALEKMKDKKKLIEVIFTFDGNENNLAVSIVNRVKNKGLPVSFIGQLNRKEMEQYYKSSVLIFSSYLETVGLPLLEAQQFGAEMLVADCMYSREAVGDYKKAYYFDYFDSGKLQELMEKKIHEFYKIKKVE